LTSLVLLLTFPDLKDSLWAAEDIEAVFDQDPQRVCILQGAVVKDEPVKELPGNINSSPVHRLLERKYGGDESMIPIIDYLSTSPSRTPAELPAVERLDGKVEVTYKISGVVPDTPLWLETLAGDRPSWLRAFVTFLTFVQGGLFVDSLIRRLAPRIRQMVVIAKSTGGVPSSVTVYGVARSLYCRNQWYIHFYCPPSNSDLHPPPLD
jgi:fatty acid synthase subunit alpha